MAGTIILKAIGLTPEEILAHFYDFDQFRILQKGVTWTFEPSRLQGETAQFDIADGEGNIIVAKDKRITARHVRLMNEKGVKSLAVSDEFLIGRVLAKTVFDKTTGEKIVDANEEITEETLATLREQDPCGGDALHERSRSRRLHLQHAAPR